MENSLNENKEIFKQWVTQYASALKLKEIFQDDVSQKGFYSFMKEFKEWLYDTIHNYLSKYKQQNEYEKLIQIYCNYIRDKILPVCRTKIKFYSQNKSNGSYINLNNWLDLEDDFFALASYRNIEMLAYYLERGKADKLWKATMPLFRNFFEYTQRIVFGEEIEVVRASYFPGAGKTYAGNILCAFWFGVDENISILRITYSDDLCQSFIKQIAEIIDSKEYRKVYPKFNVGEGYGNSELYSKFSISVGFQFSFSSNFNFYSSTRGGQTTGKRAKVLIIDDVTKGVEEAYDEKIHKSIKNKFDTEWASRTDRSYQPCIMLGTMWSGLDLLNQIYQIALKDTGNNIQLDSKYKYTEVAYNKDGSVHSVYISTPILDYDTDESTCPLRYTTAKMRTKRNNMDEFLWNAVYQQRPKESDDQIFSPKKLSFYDNETIPKEILNGNCQCYALIDPTRTGNDYFAMGIFKRYYVDENNYSKWFLVDCIYEQKTANDLMYDIIAKIVNHNIINMGYENNVDISFGQLLKTKLNEYTNGKKSIKISSFFSHNHSKETKIRNSASGIRSKIVFPSLKMYSLVSPMGKAMQEFTNWSLNQNRGEHDDFTDMLAMFVKYYCEDKQKNTMQVLKRSDFGF